MLNDAQQRNALKIWESYEESDKSFPNAGGNTFQQELDEKRLRIIPQTQEIIGAFLNGTSDIATFKSKIDSLNKQHPLWGFRGANGQMFFNMVLNVVSEAGRMDGAVDLLKNVLHRPSDMVDAKAKVEMLSRFSDSLADYAPDARSAPRTGSVPFFVSYFWHIQSYKVWPIYYNSMVAVLQDEGLWSPTVDNASNYESFCILAAYLADLFKRHSNLQEVAFWDVEHAFWRWGAMKQPDHVTPPPPPETPPTEHETDLPSSYLPPVVSVIPLLSLNDPSAIRACEAMGVSVEKAFEQRIAVLFGMLGFKVETLGQGYGRVPDGIAICSENHYAVIFDAKVRKDGYSMGTDDRAMKEYILLETDRLRRQGIRYVYFAVISSKFNEDFAEVIRTLKMETDIREVVFVEAAALLSILEQKLRNPELDLGPRGIQNIFADSGVVKYSDVMESWIV